MSRVSLDRLTQYYHVLHHSYGRPPPRWVMPGGSSSHSVIFKQPESLRSTSIHDCVRSKRGQEISLSKLIVGSRVSLDHLTQLDSEPHHSLWRPPSRWACSRGVQLRVSNSSDTRITKVRINPPWLNTKEVQTSA